MQEPNLETALESRVRRLEHLNRGLLAGLGVLACVILLGAAGADPAPEAIRTRSLEVVNETGAVQVRIAASAGGPTLELLDASGGTRLSLGHGPDDTALYIKDETGTTRIGVAQFAHGGGGVALHGEESEGAAVLYLKSGKGSLSFYGADGTVLDRLPDGK